MYEIESLQGQNPRPDIARAVVNAGWNLLELKSTTLTLEDIFLELTSSHAAPRPDVAPVTAAPVSEGMQ